MIPGPHASETRVQRKALWGGPSSVTSITAVPANFTLSRFVVSGTTRTDCNKRNRVSLCQTTTGRRPVCSRGRYGPRSAHQISPRFTSHPHGRVRPPSQRDPPQRAPGHRRPRSWKGARGPIVPDLADARREVRRVPPDEAPSGVPDEGHRRQTRHQSIPWLERSTGRTSASTGQGARFICRLPEPSYVAPCRRSFTFERTMSKTITVRQFTTRDRPAVVALWREVFADDPPWRRAGS